MGEAKRRGTVEQRVAQAVERQQLDEIERKAVEVERRMQERVALVVDDEPRPKPMRRSRSAMLVMAAGMALAAGSGR